MANNAVIRCILEFGGGVGGRCDLGCCEKIGVCNKKHLKKSFVCSII